MDFDHLVDWDQLRLRVRGARLQEIITALLREKRVPVSDVRMEFREGELTASATIHKVFSVPVAVTVETINVSGKALQIALKKVSTIGGLPVPRLLFQMVGSASLPDGVRFDATTMTLTLVPERFLPPFIDLSFDSIRIVRDGLDVLLGPGGANPPPQFG
jgi:hypothetical protein